MPTAPRRLMVSLRRIAPLLVALPLLAGCLQRVSAPLPDPATPPLATVPAGFFAATPVAPCCPTAAAPEPFPGLYALGAIEAVPPGDARATYAAPLLGRDTHLVQITLRITGLREPRTPPFAYELVTDAGVFGALASGEWEVAIPVGATYRQDGILLFVVPRELRAARLEIVEYAYPRLAPGATLPLRRTIIVAFDLPRFP